MCSRRQVETAMWLSRVFFVATIVTFAVCGCSTTSDDSEGPKSGSAGGVTKTASDGVVAKTGPESSDDEDWEVPRRPSPTAPVVKMSARKLHEELKKDEDATYKKYKGRWIQVTGTVDDFYRDAFGSLKTWRPRIVFRVPKAIVGLGCLLDTDSQPWEEFGIGSKVTLVGVLRRYGQLCYCRVLSFKGSPTPFFTVESLIKLLEDDFSTTVKRFSEKTIRLRGVVEKVVNRRECILKSPNSYIVTAGSGIGQIESFHDAGVGGTVELLGSCYISKEKGKVNVRLNSALFIRVSKKGK